MQRWQVVCISMVTVSIIATTCFTNWFQVSYNIKPMALVFKISNAGRGNDLVPRYKTNDTSKSFTSKPASQSFNVSNVSKFNDAVPRYKKNDTSKSLTSKPPSQLNASNVSRVSDAVPPYKKNNSSKSLTSKPPSQSITFVCSNPMGGLGNLMLQYAAVYAIAKRNGKKPIYFQKGLELFPNRSVENGRCTGKYISINEKGGATFNEKFFNLPPNQNVKMCCYFFSWKYMRHYENDIRREFTLSKELTMEAQGFLSDIAASVSKANKHIPNQHDNTSSITFVGVHVRRGDKVQIQHLGEIVPPRTYLEKAMSYYRSKYTNVHFVVCSNDLVWCKQNLNFTDVSFSNGRSRESDFATLVNCNHTIMTIGSFGWWAGWLAGGDVVYYYNILPNTFISKEMNKNDVFRTNWIEIKL